MITQARMVISLFVALLLVGTAGFMLTEGWSLLDSLYMTVITVSTVGFREVQPLSPAGQVFTVLLIIFGVGTLAYAVTRALEAVIEHRLLHWRRVQMEIKRIKQHVVVCGYGRMGKAICSHLRERKVPFVVIERNAALSEHLDRLGILHVVGDSTDDALLAEAGVARAKALAAVLPHDADNLFVTVTARNVNRDLTIVARASNEKNEPKMLAAGADRVLNPYRTGGRQMARQLLQPAVTEFFDVITGSLDGGLGLEEIELQAGSQLVGVTLRDAPIRREMDVILVGVRRPGEGLLFNPPSDLAPREGDVLLALGRPENLRRLEQLAVG
jgi:voltage-gated potassium channel